MASWTRELQMKLLLWSHNFHLKPGAVTSADSPFLFVCEVFLPIAPRALAFVEERKTVLLYELCDHLDFEWNNYWTCSSDQKWSLNPNALPEVVASHVFLSTDTAE